MLTSLTASNPIQYVGFSGVPITYTSAAMYGVSVWCPTFRYQFTANVPEQRNSSSIYYRGVRDSMDFRSIDGTPWVQRRIVVGSRLNVVDTAAFDLGNQRDTGRLFSLNKPSYAAFLEVIMRGTSSVDWVDPITAKVDQKRVTLYHDKVYKHTPQTANGSYKTIKFWHPINKTIMYDDEENGSTNNASPWAANQAGNENIYIVDIWVANAGGVNAPAVNFQATSYWHER